MKKNTIIGLMIIAVLLLAMWVPMASFLHGSYYATLRHVQTVDLNILHHTLPQRISMLLAKEDSEEILRVLNSNMGKFPIIITDNTGSSILYANKAARMIEQSQILKSTEPYDEILLDPAGRADRIFYKSSYDAMPARESRKGDTNKIVARVYYYRSEIPSMIDSLTIWAQRPWGGGLYRNLTILTVGVFFIWVFAGLSWLKYKQAKESEIQRHQTEIALKRTEIQVLAQQRANIQEAKKEADERHKEDYVKLEKQKDEELRKKEEEMEALLKNVKTKTEKDIERFGKGIDKELDQSLAGLKIVLDSETHASLRTAKVVYNLFDEYWKNVDNDIDGFAVTSSYQKVVEGVLHDLLSVPYYRQCKKTTPAETKERDPNWIKLNDKLKNMIKAEDRRGRDPEWQSQLLSIGIWIGLRECYKEYFDRKFNRNREKYNNPDYVNVFLKVAENNPGRFGKILNDEPMWGVLEKWNSKHYFTLARHNTLIPVKDLEEIQRDFMGTSYKPSDQSVIIKLLKSL